MELWSWFTLVFYKQQWIVSKYPPTSRISKVTDISSFDKNIDDRMSMHAYASQKWFFKNFAILFSSITHPWTIMYALAENADFANEVLASKNVYLSSTVIKDCENVLYSSNIKEWSSDVLNSVMVWNNSQNVYMWVGIIESSNIFYSRCIKNSSNIWFCVNCVWCSHCMMCVDMENASYCIRNKQYTKEEYIKIKTELLKRKDKFYHRYKQLPITWKNIWSTRVTWSFVCQSQDVENWLYSYWLKQVRNSIIWWGKWVNEYMADIICWCTIGNDHIYGVVWAWAWSSHLYCSCHIVWSHIYYCYYMENCSFCLWCVGLKNKQFCILNKQYTKEEWHQKVNKIFATMEKEWSLWFFFPAAMCPYYFNDTIAYQLDDSFTKEEVEEKWYLRRDEVVKVDIPEWIEVVNTSELGKYEWWKDNTWWIDHDITKKVIQDKTWNIYRIIGMEYDFLMKHGLPLPRKHRLERLKNNIRMI